MNRTDLVNEIAGKAKLTKVDAKKVLDVVLTSIADAVAANDKVTLVGFGTFSQSLRKERSGINPATKKSITIPAKKGVKFKAGADFVKGIK